MGRKSKFRIARPWKMFIIRKRLVDTKIYPSYIYSFFDYDDVRRGLEEYGSFHHAVRTPEDVFSSCLSAGLNPEEPIEMEILRKCKEFFKKIYGDLFNEKLYDKAREEFKRIIRDVVDEIFGEDAKIEEAFWQGGEDVMVKTNKGEVILAPIFSKDGRIFLEIY